MEYNNHSRNLENSMTSLPINPNAQSIKPTEVRQFSESISPSGFDLAIGDLRPPEFFTPIHIQDAAIQALRDGKTFYPPAQGILPLREAVCSKFVRDSECSLDPANVLITTGATEALFVAMMTTLSPGDEVLVPDPSHDIYRPILLLAHATAVPYSCAMDTQYQPDPEEISCKITSRTRAIIVNTPYSPTGQVLSANRMQAIINLAERFNLWIISDETYDQFTFDGIKHQSFLSFPGTQHRTLIAGALSKSYAMTGWRVGYLIGPAPTITIATKVHRNVVSGVNTIAQWAGVAALNGDQKPVEEFVHTLSKSRQIAVNAINAIDGLTTIPPQGTFYLYAHIEAPLLSAREMAQKLLRYDIATVPGSNWGTIRSDEFLRLSFSHRPEFMARAMNSFTRVIGTS